MMGYGNYWGEPFPGKLLGGMVGAWVGALVLPFLVWSIFWKGWALWKAAKADSKIWFVALLVLNTLGILDILYIFLISKQGKKSSKK